MNVTDELLSAVAELEPLQLHEFEKMLSLSLFTDRRFLSIALASEEPPLHHHDQLFELNVVVDMETFAEIRHSLSMKTRPIPNYEMSFRCL